MSVRAKFRCTRVELNLASRIQPKYAGMPWKEAEDAAKADGEPLTIPWSQPQVTLSPVTPSDDEPENRLFWEASPSGEIKLAINNPEAAEIFEVGRAYYVDFEPADG